MPTNDKPAAERLASVVAEKIVEDTAQQVLDMGLRALSIYIAAMVTQSPTDAALIKKADRIRSYIETGK